MRVAPAFLLLALLPCRVDARPVPLPEVEVQEVLARGLDGMDPGPAGRAVLFAGLASELGSDGVLQTVEHRVERALTLRGGRELGILGITGGGCAGEASLLAVRVHRADGRMVEVPVESAREAAFMPPGACRPSRSKLLQLPRLLPGDSVERMVLRRDHDLAALDGPDGREPLLPRMDAQLQGTVSFAEGVPVVEKVFSLVLPPGTELQLETSGRLASVRRTVLEDGRTRLRLEAEHIPGWPSDGLRSGRGEAPPVAVLSTLRDWRALSSWLRWVTEPLLVPDEGLRAAAGVMVKGARTPDEAALRLLEHVAGILGPGSSGGPHGEACPPGPGLRTSRLRSGTAADLAVLLVTLLRAAGVQDAWLALELGEAGWSEVPGVGPGRWVAAWERSPGDLVVLDPSRPSRAGGGVPAAPAVARILAAAS
ncbi:MAG: DUF3857 domain-containing protein, partial [Deltaproteobacteria bacterium]|nr:DUF3857 domain-containing protein [Deltaproteobacteria bacterium]